MVFPQKDYSQDIIETTTKIWNTKHIDIIESMEKRKEIKLSLKLCSSIQRWAPSTKQGRESSQSSNNDAKSNLQVCLQWRSNGSQASFFLG